MVYFTKDFLDFFKELAANNHKDWFDDNRKRYEKSIKKPFENFINDLIAEVRKHDPAVNLPHKDAIFRINRDIRFSKDKSPYKLDRSAIVSAGGRKNHSHPGMYVSLGPEWTMFGGGSYFLEAAQLKQVRTYIANNISTFQSIYNNGKFVDTYGKIKGEAITRLPKEMKKAAEKEPLLYNKQFYFMAQNDPEIILKDSLMDIAMDHYWAGKDFSDFLKTALSL